MNHHSDQQPKPNSDNPQRYTIRRNQPQNEHWERQTLRDILLENYKEKRRARIWKSIWRGIYLLVALSIIVGVMRDSGDSKSKFSTKNNAHQAHTAVIDLTGVIGGDDFINHVEILRDGMTEAYNNNKAKAIIIRANSPGGSPVVSNIAFQEIEHMKSKHPNIPVYVVAEDTCASGCYYIAAAADKIYADQSSIVGSIGVIGSSFDATGLMEKLGIKRRLRTAGSNKGMGDPFSSETPQQQAIWQNMLNQIHGEFIGAVRKGRGDRLKEKQFPDVFSGRVYTGLEAKQVGLIDDYGNVYSVARDVVKAPTLVDYTPRTDNLSRLLGRGFRAEIKSQIQKWTTDLW